VPVLSCVGWLCLSGFKFNKGWCNFDSSYSLEDNQMLVNLQLFLYFDTRFIFSLDYKQLWIWNRSRRRCWSRRGVNTYCFLYLVNKIDRRFNILASLVFYTLSVSYCRNLICFIDAMIVELNFYFWAFCLLASYSFAVTVFSLITIAAFFDDITAFHVNASSNSCLLVLCSYWLDLWVLSK
jgi:hypothetical protein